MLRLAELGWAGSAAKVFKKVVPYLELATHYRNDILVMHSSRMSLHAWGAHGVPTYRALLTICMPTEALPSHALLHISPRGLADFMKHGGPGTDGERPPCVQVPRLMHREGPARDEPIKDFVKYHPDFQIFLSNLKVTEASGPGASADAAPELRLPYVAALEAYTAPYIAEARLMASSCV